MTTFTRSTVSVPATRGRPFWFDLEMESVGSGGSLVDLTGADVSGILSWGGLVRLPGTATLVGGVPRLSWTADQTHNLPVSPVPEVTITIVDTAGEYHDIVVPVTTIVVPLMSDMAGWGQT